LKPPVPQPAVEESGPTLPMPHKVEKPLQPTTWRSAATLNGAVQLLRPEGPFAGLFDLNPKRLSAFHGAVAGLAGGWQLVAEWPWPFGNELGLADIETVRDAIYHHCNRRRPAIDEFDLALGQFAGVLLELLGPFDVALGSVGTAQRFEAATAVAI